MNTNALGVSQSKEKDLSGVFNCTSPNGIPPFKKLIVPFDSTPFQDNLEFEISVQFS